MENGKSYCIFSVREARASAASKSLVLNNFRHALPFSVVLNPEYGFDNSSINPSFNRKFRYRDNW
jgi:hypothetical protein